MKAMHPRQFLQELHNIELDLEMIRKAYEEVYYAGHDSNDTEDPTGDAATRSDNIYFRLAAKRVSHAVRTMRAAQRMFAGVVAHG